MGGGVVLRLSSQDSPATNCAFFTQVFCFHTLAHSFAFLHSPITKPVSFQSVPHSASKNKGVGYPRSSCNSTFLLTADRLQNRFYFRGIYLDRNRTKDQFERKNHAKHALP